MKRLSAAAALLLTLVAIGVRADEPPWRPLAQDELDRRAGYSFGFRMGVEIEQNGGSIDVEAFVQGLRDGLAGTAPVLSDSTMQAAIREWQRGFEGRAMEGRARTTTTNLAEGAAFLAKNRGADGVQTTSSGLQHRCEKPGSGARPAPGDTVRVRYEGALLDGTVVFAEVARLRPEQVISGLGEGLLLMDVGSTYTLYVPSDLAYGRNPPPSCPVSAGAVLVFRVELLEIERTE